MLKNSVSHSHPHVKTSHLFIYRCTTFYCLASHSNSCSWILSNSCSLSNSLAIPVHGYLFSTCRNRMQTGERERKRELVGACQQHQPPAVCTSPAHLSNTGVGGPWRRPRPSPCLAPAARESCPAESPADRMGSLSPRCVSTAVWDSGMPLPLQGVTGAAVSREGTHRARTVFPVAAFSACTAAPVVISTPR